MNAWIIVYFVSLLIPFTIVKPKLKLKKESAVTRGESLFSIVQNLRYVSKGKIPSSKVEIPDYKFYSEVLTMLLDSARTWGGPLQGSLKSLSAGIRREIKADREIRGLFLGGVMQFLAVTGITWGNVAILKSWIETDISMQFKIAILILQAMGFIAYLIYFGTAEKRSLTNHREFLACLYKLKSAMGAGLSTRTTMSFIKKHDEVVQKKVILKKHLVPLVKRYRNLIYQFTELGTGISEEIMDLIDDVWGSYSDEREHLKSRSQAAKFLIMAVFFLSAHLVFFVSVAGSFFVEEA